jgi:hypothetical protein
MSARAPRRASVCATRWAALAASLIALGAAAPARAALPLTLTWLGPTGCPTAADVRAEVERLVRFPRGQEPSALVADGRVENSDGRWRLRLHTERDGVEGERELEADSCASLAHAATLVIALAFGVGESAAPPPPPPAEERPSRPPPRPHVVEAPPPPPPPPPPPATPPPPPPAAPPPAPAHVVVAAPAPPRTPLVWSLAAETRVSSGPFPGVDWGAGAGLDAAKGRVVVGLRAVSWLPADDAIAGMSTRMQLAGAGLALSVCGIALERARLSLAACAVGGGAALAGTSTGGLSARSVTAPWYWAGGAVRVRVRLWRGLHLEARAESATSLTRPKFALDTEPPSAAAPVTVYTVRPLVPAAALGVSLDL